MSNNTDSIYTASAIHAYRALYMLNPARIGAMLSARNFSASVKILADCGYVDLNGTVDKIVEHERTRTYEMFLKLCTDDALKTCVSDMWNFKNVKVPSNNTLENAEKTLEITLRNHAKGVKNAQIRAYFDAYLDAWAHGQKASDRVMWNIAHELSMDLGGMGALFFWYVQKNSEFMAVRIILGGKVLGLEREKIVANLGVLYERFK